MVIVEFQKLKASLRKQKFNFRKVAYVMYDKATKSVQAEYSGGPLHECVTRLPKHDGH
jgi:hypothetical protein